MYCSVLYYQLWISTIKTYEFKNLASPRDGALWDFDVVWSGVGHLAWFKHLLVALTCEGNHDDAPKRAGQSVYDQAGRERAASPETHSRVTELLQTPAAPCCRSSLGGCTAGIIHVLVQMSAPQNMGGGGGRSQSETVNGKQKNNMATAKMPRSRL